MIEAAGSHVLVFPYPAQGHLLPLLDLTHQLAIRGLEVTVLVTPKNLHSLDSLVSRHPHSVKPLVFPFPETTLIPPGVENTKDFPPSDKLYTLEMMCVLKDLEGPLIGWFESHPSPPVAIISDMFLGWTHRVACRVGARRYVFSPSAAMAISVIYSVWVEFPRIVNEDDEDEVVSFPKLPNCPKYPWWKISPIYRSYLRYGDNPRYRVIKDGFLDNVASYGLVINTFGELEGVYIDHLKGELGHQRVWSVGPLLPPDDGSATRGRPNLVLDGELCHWLDSCEDGTVLYVCFGSQHVWTDMQIEAVASGLEKSGVKFIWSMKGEVSKGGSGKVPSGFEDRVAGRGRVVNGWVPQVSILRHRAVGAFLTHCGWNSILESLVAGVPMLAWPMGADQFVDATLLVDELKVAVRLCEGKESVPDPVEFASSVAKIMGPCQAERVKAKDLSRAAWKAVRENGESYENLNEFVKHIAKQ